MLEVPCKIRRDNLNIDFSPLYCLLNPTPSNTAQNKGNQHILTHSYPYWRLEIFFSLQSLEGFITGLHAYQPHQIRTCSSYASLIAPSSPGPPFFTGEIHREIGSVRKRFLVASLIPLVGEDGQVNPIRQQPHFTKRQRGSEEQTLPHILCTLQAGFPDVAIQRQMLPVRTKYQHCHGSIWTSPLCGELSKAELASVKFPPSR